MRVPEQGRTHPCAILPVAHDPQKPHGSVLLADAREPEHIEHSWLGCELLQGRAYFLSGQMVHVCFQLQDFLPGKGAWQGLLPYGAQLLAAAAAASVTPAALLPWLFYPILMGLTVPLVLLIRTSVRRKP